MIYDDILFDQSLSLLCDVGPVGSTKTVPAEIMDRVEYGCSKARCQAQGTQSRDVNFGKSGQHAQLIHHRTKNGAITSVHSEAERMVGNSRDRSGRHLHDDSGDKRANAVRDHRGARYKMQRVSDKEQNVHIESFYIYSIILSKFGESNPLSMILQVDES